MNEWRKHHPTVTIREELYNRLKELARKTHRSIPGTVEYLVMESAREQTTRTKNLSVSLEAYEKLKTAAAAKNMNLSEYVEHLTQYLQKEGLK